MEDRRRKDDADHREALLCGDNSDSADLPKKLLVGTEQWLGDAEERNRWE